MDYKKKYLKYKSKYLQLNNMLGGKKKQSKKKPSKKKPSKKKPSKKKQSKKKTSKKNHDKSKPSIRFQKLRDYFISIRNKKIIEDIKKLQEKYHM